MVQNFEKLVSGAIAELPEHIQEKMDNVAVCVEKEPSIFQLRKAGTRVKGNLLGLYQGVPKTSWGRQSFSVRLPDKITIFQKTIEQLARTEKETKDLVKIVVWHEIAHHFGFSENKVRELEQKWQGR